MKKTLALLIAVLMVVAMLPLSILTVAAEEPAEDLFAVYDEADVLVGSYATLAEAELALDDGLTLKLLADYTAEDAYVWGAAREGEADPVAFAIDGNGFKFTYAGAGAAWTFGASCTAVTLINVEIEAAEVAIEVTDGAVVTIVSGVYTASGAAVVRTMAGSSADNPAVLSIYGGEFVLNASANVKASDAVITNGTAGNVYIYAGVFVNNNDAVNGGVSSNYVLNHTNAAGDFQIYGGVMMATGVQIAFFQPANTAAAAGVALPNYTLPVVSGLTPKTWYEGREYYYTSYGAGELLLVPTLSPAAIPVVTDEGSGLAFVSVVSADLKAAIRTWARGMAYEAGLEYDDYSITFGTLITAEEIYLTTGGALDGVIASAHYFEMTVDEEDLIINANGDYQIVAVTPEIETEWKEMRFIAIPFIELTLADDAAQRWYGEFNISSGISSMASAAAVALQDNADYSAAAGYLYPSITAVGAFSRYTVEQQQVLVDYLAHEHKFNFRGECTAEGCDENVAKNLVEDVPSLFYAENGSADFFTLALEGGVSYTIGFTSDVASYQLYDENGNLCTLTNGIFTPAASANYYLRVNGEKVGACEVVFTHVHHVNYLGECTVCTENIAIAATVGTDAAAVVVKGNSYVFTIDLEEGVTYSVRAANGTFVLYNEAGEAQTVTDNIYTCAASGTYYIALLANYTGKAIVSVNHFHTHDHTGLCVHCGEYLGVQLSNVYAYSVPQRVKAGDRLYLNIRLEVGKTYKIVASSYVGSFKLFDAEGVEQTLANGAVFTCTVDGQYFLRVNVQTDTNAQIRFEVDHGTECTYNNKGECSFEHVDATGTTVAVSCGKTNRTRIMDDATVTPSIKAGTKAYFFLDYLSANVTYHISIAGELNYALYKADGTELTGTTAVTENGVTTITYKSASDAVIYLVLENVGSAAYTTEIKVWHDHIIDHRGQCEVKNTTTGTTPAACKEKKVTTLYAGTAATVVYEENVIYRYVVSMQSGVEYRIDLANATATWELKDVLGTTVYSSADTTAPYIPTATANYYLVVTATAASTGTEDVPATLLVSSHAHSFNNKGECVGENCDKTFNKQVLEVGVEYDGYLATGTHYFNVELEAGNVYKLSFSANGVTYVLYGGENADVAQVLVDGMFECTTSSTYYYVVTVTEDVPAHETYMIETVEE